MTTRAEVHTWLLGHLAGDAANGDAIDSLAGVELVLGAEEAFQITVPQGEISSELCSSIDQLTDLLYGLVAAREADA